MENHWKNFISKIICSCLVYSYFFCTFKLFAKDFGVVGHTYVINEQDIVEYIKQKLVQIDLEVLNEKAQAQVKAVVERPKPVPNITRAIEAKTYYYDPTFVLDEEIRDHRGAIIHLKGTTINPLEKVKLPYSLIFIDGNEEPQVKCALESYKKFDEKLKIILVNGAPVDLQKRYKIWFYFDQFGFLTSKLGIKHVPAIVTQEGLTLKIREVITNKS